MSPKELLYIEDALGHEQHLQTNAKRPPVSCRIKS